MARDKKSTFVVVAPGTSSPAGGGGGLPGAHASTHQNGGTDEINVAGLSGVLADPQPPIIGAGAAQAVAGNDTRLTDARTPTAHATSHKSGGSDAIKLDELAAPTDIATLNASTTVHGLLKKLSNVSTEFMNGVGNWATPSSGTWTVISNTDTGAQNNWAPAGLSGNTLIEWNGAADIAPTGLAGGTTGQIVRVKNITAAKLMTFAHASGSSTAGNRFTNLATSAATPVFTNGWIDYQYDGTNWKIVGHEQGAWITPAYAAGDFTAQGAMTWTVDAGDVVEYRYKLHGPTLSVAFTIRTTSVGGTPNKALYIKVPGGFTIAQLGTAGMMYNDNAGGTYLFAASYADPALNTQIQLYVSGFGTTNWTASTNLTHVYGNIPIEVT